MLADAIVTVVVVGHRDGVPVVACIGSLYSVPNAAGRSCEAVHRIHKAVWTGGEPVATGGGGGSACGSAIWRVVHIHTIKQSTCQQDDWSKLLLFGEFGISTLCEERGALNPGCEITQELRALDAKVVHVEGAGRASSWRLVIGEVSNVRAT